MFYYQGKHIRILVFFSNLLVIKDLHEAVTIQ